jgi:hypothetical protein
MAIITSKTVILCAGVVPILMTSGRLGPPVVQGGKAVERISKKDKMPIFYCSFHSSKQAEETDKLHIITRSFTRILKYVLSNNNNRILASKIMGAYSRK